MTKNVYTALQEAKQKKKFAVLIDPDSLRLQRLEQTLQLMQQAAVDILLVGGSLILDDQLEFCLETVRQRTQIPILLFPGSPLQISSKADAILLLSLISGRNPELLIGQHVIAAPYLKKSGLEIISTGYMLVDGGAPTTATYMSHTLPIPAGKPDIAASTAMAGAMLGLSTFYLDAGSGARQAVPTAVIRAVAAVLDEQPLIVGGGIRTPEKIRENLSAGADIIVVGNAIEKDPDLMLELSAAVHGFSNQ